MCLCIVPDVFSFFYTMQNTSQYLLLYNEKRKLKNYGDPAAHTFAYDAVWAMALALNKTAQQINSNTLIKKCQNLPGNVNISLDQFQYNNSKLSCYLNSNLQETNFNGVSVCVQYISNF